MNKIKNLHKLSLPEQSLQRMEYAADLHWRHNRIEFKIQEVTPAKLTIRVTQAKNPNGNYFTGKDLARVAHETFDSFFPDGKVVVNPLVYIESPVNQVSPEWIAANMQRLSIRQNDIVQDTGIPKAQLANYINGTKGMPQTVKAFFFYYFMAKAKPARKTIPLLDER